LSWIQLHFAGLPFSGLEDLRQMQTKCVPVALEKVQEERLLEEDGSFRVQLFCSSEICFNYQALLIEAQIADGRKVVEVGIARAGFFELCLCAAQFLVLDLELNLMDLKLVDQLAHILTGAVDGGIFHRIQCFFGLASKI